MTYPPPGGQWQPNDPNPYPQQPGQPSGPVPAQPPQQGYPQTGPQQALPPQGFPQTGPQPQYDPAQFGQPHAQQPQYGQQPYDPAQAGQQPYGQPVDQYGQPVPGQGYPPPRKKRTGLLVGALVAVLALVAGGIVYFVAADRSNVAEGSPNPQDAATKLVSAVGSADLAGLFVALPPAEGALLRDLNKQVTEELKRLEVFKKDANPDKVAGIDIKTENLRFDDAQKQEINDHLTITMLVDGKITVTSDARGLPLTDKFLDAAFGSGAGSGAPETETIDIGKQVQRTKKPVRIATVKVDGEWYPSLFYTVADYALLDAKKSWPKTPIPANGAGSPGEAVRQLADASLDGNLQRVIELMPPDEMGALHDAGPVLLDAIAGEAEPTGAKITKLETDTKDVTGGTKVVLRDVEVEVEGERYRVVRKGDCFEATGEGETHQLCAADAAKEIGGSRMSAGAKSALTRLSEGMLKNGLGVVTTEVDGKWYVSPGRSFFELALTALRSLQPQDIEALAKGGR